MRSPAIDASEFLVANLAFRAVTIARGISAVTGIYCGLSVPHSLGDGSW